MLTKKFDFEIPDSLIALEPANPRDSSKLIEVSNIFNINNFTNILDILKKNDCLVLNDTKVLPASLKGECEKKEIKVTLNKLIKTSPKIIWSVFVKPLKKAKDNVTIEFEGGFLGKLKRSNNQVLLEFNYTYDRFMIFIHRYGVLALPPYISKKRKFQKIDYQNYQTVFAKKEGAVAAPTASLHFTENLLKKIIDKGVKLVMITLHVNGGTFTPIRKHNIEEHEMHFEFGEITKNAAKIINETRLMGNKCIAVGTTVLRLLETSKKRNGQITEYCGETNIFIKPGWKINSVDGLITNFHTPKSTLFVLICAMIGINKAKRLYKFAVKNKIRFFSYGDACLLWK